MSSRLWVTAAELGAARASLTNDVRKAIRSARANVRAFAKRSLRKSWFMKNKQGAIVGERFDPFQRVGIYVPGGTAPLVSTAVMTCTLAAAAGVREIVAVTPSAKDGSVHPALLGALAECGATEVYRVGGAQAIAALAFGTKTIRPVQKIFGPGQRLCCRSQTPGLWPGRDRFAARPKRDSRHRGRLRQFGVDRRGFACPIRTRPGQHLRFF